MAGTRQTESLTVINQSVPDCLRASNEFEGEYSDAAFNDTVAALGVLNKQGLTELGLLEAHAVLMDSRDTLEAGQKGIYRSTPGWVGNRLMPPASLVSQLTREVIYYSDQIPSPRVADVLIKIHPFADGNGRIARLALYHLNEQRGEPAIPLRGEVGRKARKDFIAWTQKYYPECNQDGVPTEPKQASGVRWRDIILREILGL